MGHNPIPPPPRRTVEQQRIDVERDAYVRGSLTLEAFEARVEAIFRGRIEGTNDHRIFSQFPMPTMETLR